MELTSLLIAIGLLLAFAGVVIAVITLVKDIRGKHPKTLRKVYLGCFEGALIAIIGSSFAMNAKGSLTLLFAFLFLVGLVLMGLSVVLKIFKHPKKTMFKVGLGLTVVGFVTVILMTNIFSLSLVSFGEVLLIAAPFALVGAIVLVIKKKPSKKMWIAFGSFAVCGIALVMIGNAIWHSNLEKIAKEKDSLDDYTVTLEQKQAEKGPAATTAPMTQPGETASTTTSQAATPTAVPTTDSDGVQRTIGYEIKDGDTPIEVLTYMDSYFGKGVYVYDASELWRIFGSETATAEMCINSIERSSDIPSKFKDFFTDFVRRMDAKYPGMNYICLYENLKTLKVEELSQMKYFMKSMSLDSLGCYRLDENTIYIPEGTSYVEGEFGFQVLVHEFCHAARNSYMYGKSPTNKIMPYVDYKNSLVCECLNSEFSCSLLSYYEWDIAYQSASNMLRIMLECCDDYTIKDYFEHNEKYFFKKLDEATGYTNYAETMWKIIELRRSSQSKDEIDIPEEEFYPLYDYLCEMYFSKYLKPGMTRSEAEKVRDDFIYKVNYDVPEENQMQLDYINQYFENKLKELG